MRKYALLIVAAVAVLALPSAASAQSSCPPPGTTTVAGPVYEDSQYGFTGGTTRGACVDLGPTGVDYSVGTFYGGTAEVRVDGAASYAVVDGDDRNTDLAGNESRGYLGVSNYETGNEQPNCPPPNPPAAEGGSGSNSGGCVRVRDLNGNNLVGLPVPLVVGGHDTGPFNNSERDGWAVP